MWKNQAHLCFIVVCIYTLGHRVTETDATGSAAEPRYFLAGKNGTLSCKFTGSENPMWQKDGKKFNDSSAKVSIMIVDTEEDVEKLSGGSDGGPSQDETTETTEVAANTAISTITIHNFSKSDTGNYTCHGADSKILARYSAREVILPKITASSPERTKFKQQTKAELYCVIQMYPLEYFNNSIQWFKEDDTTETKLLEFLTILLELQMKVLELQAKILEFLTIFLELQKKFFELQTKILEFRANTLKCQSKFLDLLVMILGLRVMIQKLQAKNL